MAEIYHCIYCFDALTAHYDHRKPIPLDRIEQIYRIMEQEQQLDATITIDGEVLLLEGKSPIEPQKIDIPPPTKAPERPLFVTWNKETSQHRLRGCIGTFEPQPLEGGLQTYALTAALEDTRFNPIRLRELPELSCAVSILTDFEPAKDAMDWELGVHGLRISFVYHGRRMGATYLPDVPPEQGWTKEETIVSLMRKAGWGGRTSEWRKIDLSVIRYKGTKASVSWSDYQRVLARHKSELASIMTVN
ncbi:AMMECR1 domain-containing protein [Kalaharituber pfeilii]|nr:AMMECR1 domain-containing protein [Kalaharituber pfeilii]